MLLTGHQSNVYIFRTTGLLKSGATKEVPIWYDVYRKYPPILEPDVDRPIPPQDPILEIVYEEDFERAEASRNFYQKGRKVKEGKIYSQVELVRALTKD